MSTLCIVTGSSSGLGLATSAHLVGLGYTVLGLDLNPPEGILSPHFEFLKLDLSEPNLENLVLGALADRQLHGIVHCAAVSKGNNITNLTDEDWNSSLEINLSSAMRLCRLASTTMVDFGKIILIGSPVAFAGATKPSYAATKAGLHGLTMSVSRELGKRNILVNTILPGPMMTGMTSDWSEEKIARISKETRLNRFCKPIEVAHTIAFLLSKECSFMTASMVDMTAGSMFGH